MDLKGALWQRGKYMEYLDEEISVFQSINSDRAKEQVAMNIKMQELSNVCYDIAVDMDYSSHEETMVTITMPYSNLRYLNVTNKNVEEKNMPINMCDMLSRSILNDLEHKYQSRANKSEWPKWIEGLPAVKKVEVYNNRVVKVTFIDGTFTKSVCSENDIFDLDVGITVCAMKRLLGTSSENATREYNRFMNHVHSVMEKNTLKELAEEAGKAKEKAKKRKAELKKAAKKLKAKEEQIDIQKQAIIRAQKEMEAME